MIPQDPYNIFVGGISGVFKGIQFWNLHRYLIIVNTPIYDDEGYVGVMYFMIIVNTWTSSKPNLVYQTKT